MFLPKLPAASDFQPVQDSRWPFTPSVHLLSALALAIYTCLFLLMYQGRFKKANLIVPGHAVEQVCFIGGLSSLWIGGQRGGGWTPEGFLGAVGMGGSKTQRKLFFLRMVKIPV